MTNVHDATRCECENVHHFDQRAQTELGWHAYNAVLASVQVGSWHLCDACANNHEYPGREVELVPLAMTPDEQRCAKCGFREIVHGLTIRHVYQPPMTATEQEISDELGSIFG